MQLATAQRMTSVTRDSAPLLPRLSDVLGPLDMNVETAGSFGSQEEGAPLSHPSTPSASDTSTLLDTISTGLRKTLSFLHSAGNCLLYVSLSDSAAASSVRHLFSSLDPYLSHHIQSGLVYKETRLSGVQRMQGTPPG